MHRHRSPGVPKSGASWFRLSTFVYVLVAVVIGYNLLWVTDTKADNAEAQRNAAGRPRRPFAAAHQASGANPHHGSTDHVNVDVNLGADSSKKDHHTASANQPALALEDSPAEPQFAGSCLEVARIKEDSAKQLCARFLHHVGKLLKVPESDCASPEACASAVSDALRSSESGSRLHATVHKEWMAKWEGARTHPSSSGPGAVAAKYHPVLWHNLIGWSPQLAAAAFGVGDVGAERDAWRHGKREPNHRDAKGMLLKRTNGDIAEHVCEEAVEPVKFLSFSSTMRVLFEAELLLAEQKPELQKKLQSGAFVPLTSFHTVWGMPPARQCALDRVKKTGGDAAVLGPKTMSSWDGAKWNGFIDNTTGITEAARSWINIVNMVRDGSREPRSWIDFLWKDVPAKSPAIARHLLRAVTEYNPWLGQVAFTACFHALTPHLVDVSPIHLGDMEGGKGGLVIVPPALATWAMPAISDCSRKVLLANSDNCGSRTSAVGLAVPAEGADHPLDGAVQGLLPSVLCSYTIGLALSEKGKEVELAPYRQAAMNYARAGAGGCTRTILYITMLTTQELIGEAAIIPARTPQTLPDRSVVCDAVLRHLGVDVFSDFLAVNHEDMVFRHLVWDTEVIRTQEEAVTFAQNSAHRAAIEYIFGDTLKRTVTHRTIVARAEQHADGLPRNEMPHVEPFYDYFAVIPSTTLFIPTNFMRYATRRDVSASMFVHRTPRVVGHRSVASLNPSVSHQFFVMDAVMYVVLQHVVDSESCQLSSPVQLWQCLANMRLKVTDPTESKAKLVVRPGDSAASPFAFAVTGMTPEENAHFWATA